LSSSREEIIKETLEKATREIIEQLPYMKQVFLNPNYDLNKTVENEPDFFLGAFCASILERNAAYLWRKQIRPTLDESAFINHFVFSQAPEFKDHITKSVGL
jgi:hypothetical protein